MPFLEPQTDIGMRTVLGTEPAPPDTSQDVFGAAARQNLSFVSVLHSLRNEGSFAPVPGYNPMDDIKNTPYFESHPFKFAASQSPAETQSIMRRINEENADKHTIASNGKLGTVAGLMMGSIDPVWLLAFGAGGRAVSAIREAHAGGAVRTGILTAKGMTAQEIALGASQETRGLGESAEGVATATLLWAMIGGAAGRLLSREGRLPAATEALSRDRAALTAHGAGEPAPAPPVEPPISGTPGLPEPVGAAATDTRTLERVPTGIGLEKLPLNPQGRMLTQPSISGRRATADLTDIPTEVQENLKGQTTTLGGGPPVEIQARLSIDQTRVAVGDQLDRLWTDLRFAGEKAPWFAKARDQLGMLNRPPELPTFAEFKTLVSEAIQNGGEHAIPQVKEAADFIKQKVFDVWGPRAEATIEEFKQLTPKEGEGYFPHLWNKALIAARRPEFVNRLTDLYRGDQARKAAAKDRLTGLQADLEAATEKLTKAKTEEAKIAATAEHASIRSKIEDELAAWEGKSPAEAKVALKAREKYAAEAKVTGTRTDESPRLEGADKAVDRAVKRIIASDRDLSVQELRDKAHETVERIMGSPDGRLNYEAAGTPEIGYKAGGDQLRGSLAGRQLDVSNAWAKDWIESDIEHVLNSYMRSVIPDTLIAERFGDVRMTDAFRKIEDDYARLIDVTKSEKERTALQDQRKTAIEDLAAMRDRLRGVYGLDVYNASRGMARVAAAAKNYNVLTSMGMAAISSLPDIAGSVMRWGMGSTFRDAWAPFMSAMLRGDLELPREALRQFRAMGVAMESVSAQRHRALTDIMDGYKPQSRLERTLQWGADKFQFVNMLGPWTDLAKTINATVASAEIFRAVEAMTKGTATAKQVRALAANNIDAQLAERIAKQYAETGGVVDGVNLPNSADWTDRSAREAFEGAIAREVNIGVVTPGQEKPLWLSHPVYNILGQFKSFTAAATERILIANLQRHDAQVMQGVVLSMGLGMLSYKVNSVLGGQPVSDRPQDWVKEAISRGNLMGWFEEGNAMSSKMTRGGLDIYRLIGADKPLSRYAGRSVLDQMLGPTAGKIEALSKVTGAVGAMDWNASDSSALRKLTAFQNVFWLRNMFNAVEAGANNAFNIPMKKAVGQ